MNFKGFNKYKKLLIIFFNINFYYIKTLKLKLFKYNIKLYSFYNNLRKSYIFNFN